MGQAEPPAAPRQLTAWQAIFAGQVVVNLPIVLLFYGVYRLAQPLVPNNTWGHWLGLLAPFIASMAWGIYASRRWQRWAIRRGVNEVELTRLAGLTLLMMPRAGPRQPPAPPRKPKKK
jgi:hypothetical protein